MGVIAAQKPSAVSNDLAKQGFGHSRQVDQIDRATGCCGERRDDVGPLCDAKGLWTLDGDVHITVEPLATLRNRSENQRKLHGRKGRQRVSKPDFDLGLVGRRYGCLHHDDEIVSDY